MMQQFATSSSKLAVLSLDANANTTFSNNADRAFDDNRSAFEKAFVDAEQSAFAKSKDFADGSTFFDEQVHQQPVIREPIRADSSARSEKVNALGVENDDTVDAKHPKDLKVPVNNSSTNSHSEDTPEIAILVSDSSEVSIGPTEEILISEGESTDGETGIEAVTLELGSIASDETINDTFDYINFVTNIQVLNNGGSDLELREGLETENTTDELFISENPSLEILNLAEQLAKDSALDQQQSDAQQVQDLANISLSEDELQMILDAQNAGVDLNEVLSDEQLAKLNELLSKMLNQFHSSEEIEDEGDQLALSSDESTDAALVDASQSNENEVVTTKELDLKLLQTLIAQAPVEPKEGNKDALERKDLGAQSIEKSDLLSAVRNSNHVQADAQLMQASVDNTKQAASDTSTLLENEADLTEEIALTNKASADLKSIESSLITQPGQGTPISTLSGNKENKSEISQESLKQLASMDERSQTNVLENVKLRAEKFVAELSGSASKGSEFVAAMQTGLKEFKEQLESGREPGIDMKALVSDALAEVNVEVLPRNQSKLDALGNQFSSLMTLANAVSQSSQTQAQQIYGTTEGQIIKESAVLNAEGTKLAQANPTALDKAINIFKQDGQQQLAEKVRWMVNGRNPAAEIRLDPPELGAMQVRLSMTADTASVSFTVQSVAAKEALDQATPRLREMLQEQGIELGQSSVEQQSSGQTDQQFAESNEDNAMGDVTDTAEAQELEDNSVIEQRVAATSLGGIDYYA